MPLLRHPVEQGIGYTLQQTPRSSRWHEEHFPLMSGDMIVRRQTEIIETILAIQLEQLAEGRSLFAVWVDESPDGLFLIRIAFQPHQEN
jgi:hypothetical protein